MVMINPMGRIPLPSSSWAESALTKRHYRLRDKGFLTIGEQASRINLDARMSQALTMFRQDCPDKGLMMVTPGPHDALLFERSFLCYRDRVQLLRAGYLSVVALVREAYESIHAQFVRHGVTLERTRFEDRAASRMAHLDQIVTGSTPLPRRDKDLAMGAAPSVPPCTKPSRMKWQCRTRDLSFKVLPRLAGASRDRTPYLGFLSGLFEGVVRRDLFRAQSIPPLRDTAKEFLEHLRLLLIEKVDPERIDREGEVGEDVFAALKAIGAFGLKIPAVYGGLGLTQSEYHHVATLLGSHDASTTVLISAHNSIGVAEPVKLIGNREQQQRLLPRLARGDISGFALTEKGAGCDIWDLKLRHPGTRGRYSSGLSIDR